MAEPTAEQFELVGDPEALPDAFFEALAAMLLELADDKETPPNA